MQRQEAASEAKKYVITVFLDIKCNSKFYIKKLNRVKKKKKKKKRDK